MRSKENADRYYYYCEPNIIETNISHIVDTCELNKNQLPDNIKEKLIRDGISNEFINILLNDIVLFDYFNKINSVVNNSKVTTSLVCVELLGIFKNSNKTIDNIPTNFVEYTIQIIKALNEEKINSKQLKEIFKTMVVEDINPTNLINQSASSQISDDTNIRQLVINIIKNNSSTINSSNTNITGMQRFIMGSIMKETKGQANPILTQKIVNEELAKI
jgi:aspartyl-tRNA(Asn)/glutamyl-tRNA(Gln) amidotransferase subunit B